MAVCHSRSPDWQLRNNAWPGRERETQEVTMYVYVDDVEKVYQNAIASNYDVIQEPVLKFYGNKEAAVKSGNEIYGTSLREWKPFQRRAQQKSR